MEMRFRLFVRQRRDGNVAASVIDIPEIVAYESSRERAIASVERELIEHLNSLERFAWGQFVFHPDQELYPLALDLVPSGELSLPAISITVHLLVTHQAHPRGDRIIVTAPRVADLYLVVATVDQLETSARDALIRLTREWPARQIVDLDLDGSEGLEVITVHMPDSDKETQPATILLNTHSQEDVLGLCGLNLSEQAQHGRLGRADRRGALVDQLITILASERMNCVLLVGRSDVGKTALVHELVERMRSGQVPAALQGRAVWSVTANSLIAGMKYTGEWQGRTQKLIAQVRKGRQILYMADPNEILDAGRWSESDNNMGRLLRPAMELGELTIICECTPEAFEVGLKTEPSFINTFRRIDVVETDESDTQAIIYAAARRFEAAHGISIEPAATNAVFDLTRRFLPYRAFPGKALRLLESTVQDFLAKGQADESLRSLDRPDVIASFTRTTGLPSLILSDEQQMRVPEVRAYFEERLLGQPDAVDSMVDLITVIKAGLNDPNKPLGSFFFVGPTGVGKTELAKVLAEFLFGSRDRMVRFDMSEYAAADALPRLIGTAWQVGSEGELTRRVREQPFCVVLLDELEKAHREVFDALLSVLGEGRLTDAHGRTADFRNAIIIMTSNLGAGRREMQAIGFGQATSSDDADAGRWREYFVKQAEGFFRPEFFNRIDRIVAFCPLTREAMHLITRRELGKLLMREGILRRNLLVEIDAAVINKLLVQWFHPLYGARPLQREIERMVIVPLARLLVEQGADLRHLLHFGVRAEQIELSLVPLELPEESTLDQSSGVESRLPSDLNMVLRAIHELRERIAGEASTPAVQWLRREVSALLARTREPTFWDQPAITRKVLSRVYHLERVLKRLDAVSERVEHLEERGRQIRRHRDRPSVPLLAREAERLASECAYVSMELAAAGAGEEHDQALVRVTPVGRESQPWAEELLSMYIAWAVRKGYEYTLLDTQYAPIEDSDRRRAAATPTALYLKGSNVFTFLRCEAGLHKLNNSTAEDRQRNLARVVVLPIQSSQEEPPTQLSLMQPLGELPAAEASSQPESSVVRVYHQGRHHFVRDVRTGVRITDVAAVLHEGQIDAFLLANLRQQSADGL